MGVFWQCRGLELEWVGGAGWEGGEGGENKKEVQMSGVEGEREGVGVAGEDGVRSKNIFTVFC